MNPRLVSCLRLIVTAAACGPTTYVGFCEQAIGAECRRLFRCEAEQARALYTDAAGCESALKAGAKCERFEEPTCTLDSARANTCLRDVENAACTGSALPASCQVDLCPGSSSTGMVTCRQSSSSGGGQTCQLELASCSDSNTYRFDCTSSTCSCKKNGVETKSVTIGSPCATLSSSALQAEFAARCETNVK